MKRETKRIIFYIMTLGIGYFIIKKRLKLSPPVNDVLTLSEKFPFKVEDIIKYLGTSDNIVSVNSTINMLKVELKDITIVDKIMLKKLGAKGMMQSGKTLSLVLGDYSKALDQAINDYIKQ